MVDNMQQWHGGGWQEFAARTEAEHGNVQALGDEGQWLRAEFVDQSVRENRIGSYQDNVCLGQTVKEGHVNAVLYGDAVGQ
jgi:hypothetical protein